MSEDALILAAGVGALPVSYTVPNAQEVEPLAVTAVFDGTAAASAFSPTLEIVSDGGIVVARVPTSQAVAAGGSAEVTWAPFLGGASSSGIGPPYQTRFDQTLAVPTPGFTTVGVDLSGGNLLEIWLMARSDRPAVGAGNVAFQFNGDASPIYDFVWIRNEAGVATLNNIHNATSIQGQIPGATGAPAGVFGVMRTTIPFYDTSILKGMEFTNGWSNVTANTFDRAILGLCQYKSPNPIASIQVATVAGNLLAGSRLIVLTR